MPRSKKNRVVSLTQTKEKGREHKDVMVNKIREAVDNYKYIYVLQFDNMRTNAFKELRSQLADSRFFLGKNRVMQVALGRTPEEEYRDNLSKLGEALGGNCTLFFTNKPKEEVLQFFKEYKSLDFARAGFKATENFVIPKGEMPFPHSMMEEFKKLRLPVELKNGIIHMREDYTVCKTGKVLTPEQCRILKLYNKPLTFFTLTPLACWSEGQVETLSSIWSVCSKQSTGIEKHQLLRGLAAELGHSLGSLGNGVLAQLAGQDQAHSGLDLSGAHSALVVHARQMTRLRHDSLEDIGHEGVHDGHSLLGDAAVGVHLLQHLVDVGGVGVHLGGLSLLLVVGGGSGNGFGLLFSIAHLQWS
ncbi:hypothetical protein WA577_003792, partial [Blastocystis sp. JDR]